ncbi:MAG: hypothetical protein OEW05_07030 [Candidatus Aminicenantes bacterium]|nr:hypothetical protein [Candidatus Aminicenantes bacterium]
MRKALVVVMGLVVAAILGVAQSVKPVDLSGTWTGFAVVPPGEKDEATLVLEKSGQTYAGRLNDVMGMLVNAEIRNFNQEGSHITFEFDVVSGSEVLAIKADLTLDGDVMKGTWIDLQDGESNVLELAKKKATL